MASSLNTVFALFLLIVGALGLVRATEDILDAQTEGWECKDVIGAEIGDGECVCKEDGYIIDSSHSHCIPDVYTGWGSACEDPIQCSHMGFGAVCKEGECRCTEGYHYLKGNCWRDKKYGDSCSKHEECYAYFESDAYTCEDNVCKCAPGAYKYRVKEGSEMCRRKADVEEECETDADCPEKMTCEQRKQSANDYVCRDPKNNNKTPSLLASTRKNIENTIDMERNTTPIPDCPENQELKPGDQCVCKMGYFPKDNSTCIPELGQPCNVSEKPEPGTAHIADATCRRSAKTGSSEVEDGVWACLGGFLPDRDNQHCQKTRIIKNNCLQDVQCAYYGGVCNDTKCACPDGFHYLQDKKVCWPSIGVHGDCVDDDDCGVETENSIKCQNKKCECKTGFHEAGSPPSKLDCRKDAIKLGDKCTDVEDCIFANSDPLIECKSTCSCIEGYIKFNNTNCITGIGGPCYDDGDCLAVNNATCFNETVCKCQEDFVPYQSKICYPVATEYEQECDTDDQCKVLTTDGKNIECSTDDYPFICLCKSNHYYRDKRCWMEKHLNEACYRENECFEDNSYCFKNLCKCRYGYHEEGDKCVDDNGANIPYSISFVSVTLLAILINIL